MLSLHWLTRPQGSVTTELTRLLDGRREQPNASLRITWKARSRFARARKDTKSILREIAMYRNIFEKIGVNYAYSISEERPFFRGAYATNWDESFDSKR